MDSEASPPAPNTLLARTGRAMIAASENEGCFPILLRWLRRLTLWSVILYIVSLLVVTQALSWGGERNVTTAFLIFLPPSIWWLPALPLAFAALLLHRRALLLLLGVMLWFAYGFLDWRPGQDAVTGETALNVMTYNRGQHMNQSLKPFKEATLPDIIVLQEAYGRAAGYAADPDYADLPHTRNLGEHTLLSRYPVLEEKMLPALPGQSPKAVRFVIDWKGQKIALYSVHLQTPREVLGHQVRGGFLYGILGLPGTPWAGKRQQMQTFWDGQIADAEIILKAVREDPLPTLLAGDFNSPHVGYVHRLITRELQDSHAEAGQGFGLSFPGSTHNPLSMGGPWLRIDYVFASRHWQVEHCVTEADRRSQHRALTSTVTLKAP